MISIYMDGEDQTGKLRDWRIRPNTQGAEPILTCYFRSGGELSRPLSACRVVPTQVLQGKLLMQKKQAEFNPVDSAHIYGQKYAVVKYPGGQKSYVNKLDDVVFVAQTTLKDEAVFRYFVSVANARIERATPQDKAIAENVLRQLDKVLPHGDTALHAYCTGQSQSRQSEGGFIYPFGVNESQLDAVERAFSSQISLIEGPPGTGKTQTILNIIANIVLRGKTVAILSNNNAAVENVYEKLGKVGLDYLLAKLGSTENRKSFFNDLAAIPSAASGSAPDMQHIQAVLQRLKQFLHAQNELARLQGEIDELTIEQQYLLQWQRENMATAPVPLGKYKLSAKSSVDLMAYMTHLAQNRIRLRDRIELLLNFRILRMKPFDDWGKRQSLIYSLQLHFYERSLQDKKSAWASCREVLERGNFKTLLEELTSASMAHLKHHLYQHAGVHQEFDSDSYRNNFDKFLKRYPILGSSTHSIINSISRGALLDYVIIDEASQQDIVPGILALGCARNLIVVGDRKQLPHIPAKLGIAAAADAYDCEKYSLLDSCVSVFNDSVPMTLLKEHYRCHPRIIQFCNQQFYDNQLIPMTYDSGEKPLQLLVTAQGNHTRKNANLRELDSVLEMLKWDGESDWDNANSRGFIAPYRAQVALSQTHLPEHFVKNTVHKFQGRECDEIVFSTVLDKKQYSQRNLGFVDNPHLVNVAVSRAKTRFTLVTGDDVFTENNGHIAALVRYMEYYAGEQQIHRSLLICAFDLLYKAYDQSLERLNARLRPSDSRFKSEQIVAQLLREALSREGNQAMTFHAQIRLNQLVSADNEALTPPERNFMRNRASCDFVLYFRVGKTPLGVIEVDGGYHDTTLQAARDQLKNSILMKSGIPLLRLRTVESHIEDRIAKFLAQWASANNTSASPLMP
ncbi:helicase [Pseudomonas agarici]|uniref:Helicase n=2 Tax=Pseudomonas agarici TaxID=46677 RepID=A0A0X1T0J9_PSEAA|nr:AAA domain-containing protein [Pseudomonas agarici]AMB85596.1 helicase [Pseudomonas agarici]